MSDPQGPWWHAFGRGRDLAAPGAEPAEVWQLVVISPSTVPPHEVLSALAPRAIESWGDYLTSWDREPTEAEKDALTPAAFRDDFCPDDPDGLHHSGCGCPDVDPINPN